MPQFNFPLGLRGTDKIPESKETLRNVWNIGNNTLMSRPGIPLIKDVGGTCRGGFKWNGDIYYVYSNDLRKFTNLETGDFTVIGVVQGPQVIDSAIGNNEVVIIAKGGRSYTLSNSTKFVDITSVSNVGGIASFNHADTSPNTIPKVGDVITIKDFVNPVNAAYNQENAVVTVASPTAFQTGIAFADTETVGKFTLVLVDTSDNPNFVPFSSVAHLNNIFVYVLTDGTKVVFSDSGDGGTIDGLSFFVPGVLPDISKVAFVLKNYLYIVGTDSTERFKDTGATPNPFTRVGGSFDVGFIGALIEGDESFTFIGRKRGQSPGIFTVKSSNWEKISNEPVDFILSTYTELELSQTIPGRFIWLNSYDVSTLELLRDSLLLYENEWSLTDTVIANVSRPWLGGFIVEFDNEYFSGSDNRLGKIADSNFDYGNRITRTVQMGFLHPEGGIITASSLELGISQGFNVDPNGDGNSVSLQTSDSGERFGPPVHRALSDEGLHSQKVIWNDPGGLGWYEGFMGIKLETLSNSSFNSAHIIIDIKI